MSYRSFNRALGQRSLELKCLFLFGAFSLLVFTASFLLYWRVTKKVVEEQNPNKGRLLADQAVLIRHYEIFYQGEHFLLVVESLTDALNEQQYDWRFVLPEEAALSAEGDTPQVDEFERDLLRRWSTATPDQLADTQTPQSAGRLNPTGDKYWYYQAVRAQPSCLSAACHPQGSPSEPAMDPRSSLLGGGVEPLEEGDLMAIVQVSIPNAPAQAAVSLYWNMLLAVAIITAFLAMVAFYVTIRYVVVKPLRHLRSVSDSISRGNIATRAEIRTGDEFEALGVAFNRMMRHLVAAQNELRHTNVKLDGKVDELAQVNMQLYEMNRVKSDFMATMSHELRTPLNSILGFSDVLASARSLDDKQQRFVQNIQKSGQMLLDMINNILDLAKIESGRMEIQLADFHIGQLVATQCDMARPLTEKKNIDLETEIQPDLPPIHQDQGRVHQILNNLLSNAIKFTPEGGRIRVTAGQNPRGELMLRVIDTGVGIAEEDQQSIFEKFRQGAAAMPSGDAITREYSGSGLGLSIVKELSKLLGGGVSVESVLGSGSTFTVRLPWRLEKQPRLDSPLMAGFEQFAKPRLDRKREAAAEPVAAAGKPSPSTGDP
jgi:two-component system sensor histidine kinase BarA